MEKLSNLLITAGAAVVGTGFFFKSFTYTVDAGERAIIFDRLFGGLKETIIGEGIHFYIPII
jgi:prohibitin 1